MSCEAADAEWSDCQSPPRWGLTVAPHVGLRKWSHARPHRARAPAPNPSAGAPQLSDALRNRLALTLARPSVPSLCTSSSRSQHQPPCFAATAETWLGATAASELLPGMENKQTWLWLDSATASAFTDANMSERRIAGQRSGLVDGRMRLEATVKKAGLGPMHTYACACLCPAEK